MLLALIGVGGYAAYSYARPYLHGAGCEADGASGNEQLDLDQAANTATIAAVAMRRNLPERALVIAYATAIQKSHLRNLAGGDRDSVGLFQQRPSQGWGRVDQLRDPVYATGKFFDSLVKVKDYLDRDLHDAAQTVQRSADGTAYAQHEGQAEELANAYSGRRVAAVRCWYPPTKKSPPRPAEAAKELTRSFGKKVRLEGETVRVSSTRTGWAVASWAVSHAQPYGLSEVRFAKRHWKADNGHDGWTKDTKAPADRVLIISER